MLTTLVLGRLITLNVADVFVGTPTIWTPCGTVLDADSLTALITGMMPDG